MIKWVCNNIKCIYFNKETPAQYGKCCFCDKEQEAENIIDYIKGKIPR